MGTLRGQAVIRNPIVLPGPAPSRVAFRPGPHHSAGPLARAAG
uniref:Uncharacterized protein n=1 Tax=Arundo donax TaxID=35708 RepID=A0A0A8YID7_ARUDO